MPVDGLAVLWHLHGMAKRSSKDEDVNTLAARIVAQATSDSDAEADETAALIAKAMREGKDPAAVLLGSRGGKRGGKARAEKLTPERRREIARLAAKSRWKKK